jgi:hypothetical protein
LRCPGGRRASCAVQRLNKGPVAVEISFVAHDEIDIRIARGRRRPLDLALPMRRRDRNGQLGIVGGGRPVAVEKGARPIVPFPSRCDKQGMVDGARGAVGYGAQKTALRPRGAAHQTKADKHDRENGKRPFQRPPCVRIFQLKGSENLNIQYPQRDYTLCWLRLRLDYLVHRAACALLDDDLGLRGYRFVGAREMPVNPFLYRLARSSSSARIGTPRLQA